MSSSPSAHLKAIETYGDLAASVDQIADQVEEREQLAAGSEGNYPDDGIIDSDPSLINREHPILKGFDNKGFLEPKMFSAKHHEPRLLFRKRPLLGPDASTSRQLDLFYQAGLDPLNECQNTELMSFFVTSMGKIKKRSDTNLTWKNQRRLGKAIRRAKMMGIIPVLSKRPLLQNNMDRVAP